MNAPDLLPCPFCGSLKVSTLRHSILQPQPCAMCCACYASAVSISAWNTRPTPLAEAKVAALVEALVAAQAYIRDLEAHEGAEGFSTSTATLGAAYHAALRAIGGAK